MESSNRTLVELKAFSMAQNIAAGLCSNRTLVELKERRGQQQVTARGFQSYLSGIERECCGPSEQERFCSNRTLVELKAFEWSPQPKAVAVPIVP